MKLDIGYFGKSPFFSDFGLLKNPYVYQNLKEIICVWTRLNLRYKRKNYCDTVLTDYILYKEKIEDNLKIIEMGSRLRRQCLLHRLPSEVR